MAAILGRSGHGTGSWGEARLALGDRLEGGEVCGERRVTGLGERDPGQPAGVVADGGELLARRDQTCLGQQLEVLREVRVLQLQGVAQHRDLDLVHRAQQTADPQPHRGVDQLVERRGGSAAGAGGAAHRWAAEGEEAMISERSTASYRRPSSAVARKPPAAGSSTHHCRSEAIFSTTTEPVSTARSARSSSSMRGLRGPAGGVMEIRYRLVYDCITSGIQTMTSTTTVTAGTPGSAWAPIAAATRPPSVRWYHHGVTRREASCAASVSRSARAARASAAPVRVPSKSFSMEETLRVTSRIGK